MDWRLRGLTSWDVKALAYEIAPFNIKVTIVQPPLEVKYFSPISYITLPPPTSIASVDNLLAAYSPHAFT